MTDTAIVVGAGAIGGVFGARLFAAGQPVVLRSPDDPAARAYTRLAELLDSKLQ